VTLTAPGIEIDAAWDEAGAYSPTQARNSCPAKAELSASIPRLADRLMIGCRVIRCSGFSSGFMMDNSTFEIARHPEFRQSRCHPYRQNEDYCSEGGDGGLVGDVRADGGFGGTAAGGGFLRSPSYAGGLSNCTITANAAEAGLGGLTTNDMRVHLGTASGGGVWDTGSGSALIMS
jgi:hypothetical protein